MSTSCRRAEPDGAKIFSDVMRGSGFDSLFTSFNSLRGGRRECMKSVRECKAIIRLDLDTLVWTRGATFPVLMLEGRLKCPRCGSRRVVLLFDLLASPISKTA
jgi:hypothetical protein